MGLYDGKVLGNLFGYLDGITLGLDVGIGLGSLDESVDGSINGKIEGLFILYSMNSTGDKVIGNILRNVDGITFGVNVGTDLVSLDGYFDGFNAVNLERLLFGDSL